MCDLLSCKSAGAVSVCGLNLRLPFPSRDGPILIFRPSSLTPAPPHVSRLTDTSTAPLVVVAAMAGSLPGHWPVKPCHGLPPRGSRRGRICLVAVASATYDATIRRKRSARRDDDFRSSGQQVHTFFCLHESFPPPLASKATSSWVRCLNEHKWKCSAWPI